MIPSFERRHSAGFHLKAEGQLVAGAVGAVVGFYVGGPTGAQWGYAIGAGLYAVSQPGPHSEGPKLNDLKLTGTDYGRPIPYVRGHPRIPGDVIYASEKRPIANTTEQGKGGGASYTSYTYEIDVFLLLSDNEIAGVSRIWDNGKLIWTCLEGSSPESLEASANTDKWTRMAVYTGAADQLPDPTYEAAVGIGRAPAYRGRGSIFIEGLKLGSSGQMSILTFEIARTATPVTTVSHFQFDFDGNTDDTAPNPLTVSQTINGDLITYFLDPTNDEEMWASYGTATGPERASGTTWSGAKLADIVVPGAEKFTIECVGYPTVAPYGGTTDAITFMGANTSVLGVQISFMWRIVAGELHVLSYRSNGGGPTIVDHGAPSSTLYKIEWGADGNIRWYNGDVVLRTDAKGLSPWGSVFVASPVFNPYLQARNLKYFIGYFGEKPATIPTITLEDETLQDVVSALMIERAGYDASEFDVSALASITKPVRALSVASIGATRATLETLMQAYYFSCVLSDKLYFFPRPEVPVTTIEWDELGASNSPEGDPSPLDIKYRNELEVPAQIALSYVNVTNDYQTGTEFSDRAISSQASTTSVQIGLGMTPAEAKGIADAMVFDNYASLAGTTLKIPFTRNEIEAGDVVTVNGDGESFRMRLVKKKDSGGILEFEAVVDDVRALQSAQITDEDYIPQTEVQAIASTVWETIDGPLLRDGDDVPGWYVAAKRGSDGSLWPGASIQQSWDGVSYSEVANFTSQSVFGTAESTLGDWQGGNVFDESSTLQVNVGSGQLSSSTRSAMLSDLTINVMLVGDEVIRFRTATMLSAGVYRLTGLIRGFRGTQWAMADHAGSERVILLSPTGLRTVTAQASQINVPRYVEGVTFNKPLSSATPEVFTDTGVRLKPFAPTDLRIVRDGSGNITGTFKRCTRLSFRFLSEGIEPPLGEALELYDVEVYGDNTYATVVRTFSALTAPEFDYSAADQTTDFGSPQSVIYARIYQRSATVGRGYPLEGQG